MCGILGIRCIKKIEAKTLAYYAMQALQHRGQESAGIVYHNRNNLKAYIKIKKGSVQSLFNDIDINSEVVSNITGHTRYSTTGGDSIHNIQPFIFDTKIGEISLVHNGNLVNTKKIKERVESMGMKPKGTTDSELIGLLIKIYLERNKDKDICNAIKFAMSICKGAVALIISTHNSIYGYRDSYGIRPLVLGKYNKNTYVLTSETCALDAIGAEYIDNIEAGTVVEIKDNYRIKRIEEEKTVRKCIFEDIYFSRPDSINEENSSIYEYRLELGRELYREHKANVDLIIGTPDSGIPAAIGYAEASGIPYGEGLIKNKYIGRSFIEPTQEMREQGVKLKLNPIPNVLKGKRIVLIDDSIVRGNTCKRTIECLRKVGVSEIHMRVSSPPVKYPCYFGLDFPDTDELAACNMTKEELKNYIGADSLGYLSINACIKAIKNNRYCTACFTGEYPV